jgi:tetratricopeptide (TPR) repeat protein
MEIIMTLETARQLRQAGQHEEARQSLVALLGATPDDPVLNYEAACAHDYLGLEREAVPFYERAIANGLTGEPLQGALLGLGSTYRALGDYEKAMATFRLGLERFPGHREFSTFLALAFYNTGQYHDAVRTLLLNLIDTTQDPNITRYERALRFYADHLDETW